MIELVGARDRKLFLLPSQLIKESGKKRRLNIYGETLLESKPRRKDIADLQESS